MRSADDFSLTSRLLQQAGEGDRMAREQLFSRHRDYLRRVIDLRMDNQLRRRIDPSDVVQEAQLVGNGRLEEFLKKRPMSFRLWLRWIAIERLANSYRHHVRARKRSVCREVPLSGVASGEVARFVLHSQPSARLRREESEAKVQQALGQLSESDRDLLLMRHAEQLTSAETAELLEITPAAAVKRHGRALRRLHEALGELGVSSPS